MKNNNKKLIIAYVIILILLASIVSISYFRFFYFYSYEVEEKKPENSSDNAINIALNDIVNNFNNNSAIQEYKNNGINISATKKNHSIYISYSDNSTTTYEFTYSTLSLNIIISNEEENLKKFNVVYEILLNAIQERILNYDIAEEVKKVVNEEKEFSGVTKKSDNNILNYSIDITKKIEKEGAN